MSFAASLIIVLNLLVVVLITRGTLGFAKRAGA